MTLHSTSPRPWYADGELSALARARHPRRHESPMRWSEWVNVRDHVRLDLAAGAQYPADVAQLVDLQPYYQARDITIYCGDCRDILPDLGVRPDDTLLSDVPYGINYQSNHNTRVRVTGWNKWNRDENFKPIAGDDQAFDPSHLLRYPHMALFGANYYADKLPPTKGWLVWDKREDVTPDRSSDCELIWTNADKPARIFRHLWRGLARRGEENVSRSPKHHPHQKPVALLMFIAEYLGARGRLIDPYMGSGSTLIAARRLGLPAVGIEISEHYCRVAVERLEGELQQSMRLEEAA